MFGELPKLFDRNFVIGFFLPVTVFVVLSGLILSQYGFAQDINKYLNIDLIVGTTVFGVISWIGGVILLAANRDLYRLLEGYGTLNPLRLLAWFEQRKYRSLNTQLEALDDEFRNCIETKKEFPNQSRKRRNDILRQLAEGFPDKEEHILPTRFGNTLRAFEVYPRVMYGIEAIGGWERILSVIPKEYLDLVGAAKAQVDFWVNLGLGLILLFIQYTVLALIFSSRFNIWIIILFLLGALLAQNRAIRSARDWGEFVKAAFDLYRFNLLELTGVKAPKNRDEEKSLWTKYSQAFIYRRPNSLPELQKTPPSAKPKKTEPTKK